jgi:hypothetical protein
MDNSIKEKVKEEFAKKLSEWLFKDFNITVGIPSEKEIADTLIENED